MKIIAFSGMPFSGKSEAVKIARKQNIPIIRMGDFIWEETKSRGLEINDENVGKIANKMRKTHGKDIWAKKTLEKIKTLPKTDKLVIDGVRNIEEIETFKKELGKDFILIAVDLSDETRYKRALNRGREDDSQDLELIKKRDKRELSWGLGDLIASADIVITNEGSLEEFKNKIKEIFDKI
jgi:dephospho-CoA kinase